MNVLSRAEQLHVLNLLVEGASLRSITRLTGVHRTTTINLMLRVGDRCVIGANSVVTRDLPDHVIAAGAPARVLREIDYETPRADVEPEAAG